MLKKNTIISFLIYTSLLSLVFSSGNSIFGITFVLSVFVFLIITSFNHRYLLPFYIYPFMLLINDKNPGNILIKLLPETAIFIAIIFFFKDYKIQLYQKKLFFSFSLFSLLTFLISYMHILEIYFIPALFRQYILPILFLIVFVNISLKKNELPFEALKIFIYSCSIISVIALLNYYNLTDNITLHILGSRYSDLCLGELTSTLFKCDADNNISRLDLLISGSTGSAAAILLTLGIVSLALSNKNNKHLKYFSLPLFIASYLSLSVSILIPIIYFFFISILNFRKYFKIFLFFFIMISYLILSEFSLFGQISALNYLSSIVLNEIFFYLAKLELLNILFGFGPIISSNKFMYFPENFIVDVGIFRVFFENGLFIFIIFAIILFYILKNNFWLVINFPSIYNRSLLIILLVLLSTVHSNWVLTPPFMVLFTVIVSGIIVQLKLTKINFK
jgi:hypothetical protein